MVPYQQTAIHPLLPFEKRLIQELGCSEEEYRAFTEEVKKHPHIRPAAYGHIPDINNWDPISWSIGISLVLGALSTAASYLLAPKPETPPTFRTKQLASKQGREVFTPSFGFDSIQELAAYGNTVPIVFTRQQENIVNFDRYISGGVLISPVMVWSRVKSWGNYQVSEIVAIAGQGPMEKPDLAAIYLGNNALDNIFKDYFDFYWNGGFEVLAADSRLRIQNLRYGQLRIDDGKGSNELAFYAPTRQGAAQPAFSGAFAPSNQIRFGVFSGIANGTPVRPDWEVISILKDWDFDQQAQALHNQKKYVDNYQRYNHPYGGLYKNKRSPVNAGMPGTGVNYARRVGIVEHYSASTGITTTHTETRNQDSYGKPYWTNLTKEVEVNKDDEIVVLFGKGRQEVEPFPYGGEADIDLVRLDDVRSAVDSELRKVDQEMALGATFMIGRSTWIVIDRPNAVYVPRQHNKDGFRIRLRCIEAWSNNQRRIGIVSPAAIDRPKYLPYADISEAFYSILRYEIGSFQNNRRCDVTEIGIKSQVWAKLNGLTNFNTIPTPGKLARFNRKNVQVREGKVTQYVKRLSVFALDVRPTNSTAVRYYNRNEGWVNIGPYLFGIAGDAPIDIYSFIRVIHPQRSQLEFRLRPFPSVVFAQQSGGEGDIFLLDGGRAGLQQWTSETYLGQFGIAARGHFIKPRDYFTHSQMAVRPENQEGESNIDKLVYGEWGPDVSRIDVVLESVVANESGPAYNAGDPIRENTLSNIMSLFFSEDPYFNNLPNGSRRTKSGWTYNRDPNRSIVMTITVESYEQSYPGTPRNRWWRIVETDVESFTGEWNEGDIFTKNARNKNNVQFGFTYRIILPTAYIEYATPRAATRLFEAYSGIAEVSHYNDLVTRSCDAAPEHEIVYINECLAEDVIPEYSGCAVMGLKLRSSDNFRQLDQVRCMIANGIQVERLIDGDVASSNLLTDLLWYLVTDKDTGAGGIINRSLIDRDALVECGRFLRANHLFFDDAIAEPINLRSWLAEVAPSVLCFTALKNGKLGIEPALPYNSSYEIDATRPVPIKGMFTDGNIIEDSLTVQWLELQDRKLFQAAVSYRWTGVNKMPEQRTIVVRYSGTDADQQPLEQFEFNHITGNNHALLAARYFLAVRKHITHTLTFKTLPWGLELAPGDYIRVASEVSPYNPSNNGIIKEDGTVVAISELADGDYNAYYWERGQTEVVSGTLQISNGIARNMRNAVFSIISSTATSRVYQIEALDVDADGIVTVKASNHPIDSSGASLIARDTLDLDNRFEIVGGLPDE